MPSTPAEPFNTEFCLAMATVIPVLLVAVGLAPGDARISRRLLVRSQEAPAARRRWWRLANALYGARYGVSMTAEVLALVALARREDTTAMRVVVWAVILLLGVWLTLVGRFGSRA